MADGVMMPAPHSLHARTPYLTAIDPRGLSVVGVAYHRRDARLDPEVRTHRQSFDALGRLRAQWDARLWADGGDAGEPNQSTHYGTSGRPLRNVSVDAGWRMALFDGAGQACESWDGRGTQRWADFDEQLRPLSVTEQMDAGSPCCVERFIYGGNAEVATNRCGQIIRHDDTAGSRVLSACALSGGTLAALQRFLADLATPDWPMALTERDTLLETDAQGLAVSFATRWRYEAAGGPWQQTDAAGHVRRTFVDVAGRPVKVDFLSTDAAIPVLLSLELDSDAFGRATAEMAGNGVVTRTTWSAVDGRLQHRQASRLTHRLQDVDYSYDPVGNVLRIEDRAQPTTWFDGSQVAPVSTYGYDTLYQLIEATGRESVQATSGSTLPGLVLPGGGDASRLRMYRELYIYDAGGNLRILDHLGSDQTQFTRLMAVAARNNRSLFQPAGTPPPDISAGFDANGNQQALDGQPMVWDARNQLQRVTQIARKSAANDEEFYAYGVGGMRQRKVRTTQAKAVSHTEEVRYLPGLELHCNRASGEVWEVSSIPAGQSVVRWLHWLANGRKPVPSPQWRYSIDDHLGSVTLELDDKADVLSHEGYYPFGGTAWWAARSEVEATRKTIRYSGKERDATGLYYYGLRYYAAWLCRWINPDPAGDVDGQNLFCMVRSNPVTSRDAAGNIGMPSHLFKALDLARDDPLDAYLVEVSRDLKNLVRRYEPLDLASFDRDRPVNVRNDGAFDAWVRFSGITKDIIREVTDTRRAADGPRKSELGQLTAHAGYFNHATKELHAGFVNLPASLSEGAKATPFPGVRILGKGKFKATTVDELVSAVSQAYDNAGDHYRWMGRIASARERESLNPLHNSVGFTLRAHIARTIRLNDGMYSRNGVPGMHAEVQAYNHAVNAGLTPADFTIFTQKLDKNIAEPTDFAACYNCASLIPRSVFVFTDRKEAWPTELYMLGTRHRNAAGHASVPGRASL